MTRDRARRLALYAVGLAAFAVAWAVAAHALWHSVVPGDLHLPHLDEHRYFRQSSIDRASSFGAFLDVDSLLAAVVVVGVLVLYARQGIRLMRESAAGPIGTGMLLGMLGLGIAWIAQLPFGIAGLWWERKHHVSTEGYLEYVVGNFLSLGGTFLFVSLALLIVMGLARLVGRLWWIPGAAAFVGLSALFALVSPFLLPRTHPLEDPALRADARALARKEGLPGTPVRVQRVKRFTSAPNAEALGLGGTKRVILWDTLVDDFSRPEVRVVMAHELGHLKRHHIAKDIGWFALFALPTALAIAAATRRRGGMAVPEAVPVALLVLVALQLVAQPLQNVRSRHVEAEADWIALQTTRDPEAARNMFQQLAHAAREEPNPPVWSYVLNADHPTAMQRIAMVEAWEARQHSKPRLGPPVAK